MLKIGIIRIISNPAATVGGDEMATVGESAIRGKVRLWGVF